MSHIIRGKKREENVYLLFCQPDWMDALLTDSLCTKKKVARILRSGDKSGTCLSCVLCLRRKSRQLFYDVTFIHLEERAPLFVSTTVATPR